MPFHAWSPEVRHQGRKRFTPHHRVPVTSEGSERGKGSGLDGPQARPEVSKGSSRSGRSAGDRNEASLGAGRGHGAGREVVIPMPSREDLGTAHLDPPLGLGHPGRQAARACLAAEGCTRARQAATASFRRVGAGRGGPGVHADPRIPFPCPLVIKGGSNVPEGQSLVGMFACRLVSGHSRVQTGVAGIGGEGTVTSTMVIALAAVVGWEQRRAEWVGVAWLTMRVHVGRMWGKGGGGGLASSMSRGRMWTPPPPPAAQSRKPPSPADTCAPPSKTSRTNSPAEGGE